ncbi:hypothetical protein AYI70_g2560 [Smittium culicis]|uniref:Uncharacterized protein n=1 Tax=Smittium culicis TaxID=133412 RepID=A0A1R1Y7I2_9FUNG|nr:hypothetical protein AYI70_g12227 [Smittium culicis]OMJ22947.1 hypothetical protein AYI70_g2560 [Smittium culicis]
MSSSSLFANFSFDQPAPSLSDDSLDTVNIITYSRINHFKAYEFDSSNTQKLSDSNSPQLTNQYSYQHTSSKLAESNAEDSTNQNTSITSSTPEDPFAGIEMIDSKDEDSSPNSQKIFVPNDNELSTWNSESNEYESFSKSWFP